MIYLAILEITDKCNLHCKHCYSKFENDSTISLSDFENVIIQLLKNGCSTLRISGGEPTLIGDIIFEYAKISLKYIDRIEITTNGTNTNIFKDSRWNLFSNIQISLDGTEKIHDKIRGKNNYRKSLSSIEKLLSLMNNVSVMMTVGRHNIFEVEKINNLLKQFDVPLFIERITGIGRANPNEELTPDEIKNFFKLIKRLNIKTTDPLYVFFDDRKREYLHTNKVIGGCSAGVSAICINSKLDVLPCPRLRIKCGNLKEISLNEILQSPIMESIRDRDQLQGECGKCDERWICGGCRASAFASYNDYLAQDPGCFKQH